MVHDILDIMLGFNLTRVNLWPGGVARVHIYASAIALRQYPKSAAVICFKSITNFCSPDSLPLVSGCGREGFQSQITTAWCHFSIQFSGGFAIYFPSHSSDMNSDMSSADPYY